MTELPACRLANRALVRIGFCGRKHLRTLKAILLLNSNGFLRLQPHRSFDRGKINFLALVHQLEVVRFGRPLELIILDHKVIIAILGVGLPAVDHY